ncbi:MAG TPA: hypothetical protein PLV93_08725 [Microthrixaceae bacterium]|nr:hypothetical protein [Microthrixaceae bacterium]HNI35470.1 hypothetical protein [Microthrixaceae bacterium]
MIIVEVTSSAIRPGPRAGVRRVVQQSAMALKAAQICWRPPTPRLPSRLVSTDFGTVVRLSEVATLSWSIPSSAPTGMHVGMERIELVRERRRRG